MTSHHPGLVPAPGPSVRRVPSFLAVLAFAGPAVWLAGCATPPPGPIATVSGFGGYDPKLGVYASQRVVADGQPVPRGGGGYLTGRPYVIGGRQYVPRDYAGGYSATGTASWYGDAFHGRRTANGEIFDKGSISAAHPTLPLPSYVRVTNLTNGRSMIVRVNDRGPYHGGRVMDVSQRVAEALDFRRAGTARIKIDYVGKAGLAGDDEEKLASTLRTDGQLARLDGYAGAAPTAVADNDQPAEPPRSARAERVAAKPEEPVVAEQDGSAPAGRTVNAPVPPSRPYDAGSLQALINDPHPSLQSSRRRRYASNLVRGN